MSDNSTSKKRKKNLITASRKTENEGDESKIDESEEKWTQKPPFSGCIVSAIVSVAFILLSILYGLILIFFGNNSHVLLPIFPIFPYQYNSMTEQWQYDNTPNCYSAFSIFLITALTIVAILWVRIGVYFVYPIQWGITKLRYSEEYLLPPEEKTTNYFWYYSITSRVDFASRISHCFLYGIQIILVLTVTFGVTDVLMIVSGFILGISIAASHAIALYTATVSKTSYLISLFGNAVTYIYFVVQVVYLLFVSGAFIYYGIVEAGFAAPFQMWISTIIEISYGIFLMAILLASDRVNAFFNVKNSGSVAVFFVDGMIFVSCALIVMLYYIGLVIIGIGELNYLGSIVC